MAWPKGMKRGEKVPGSGRAAGVPNRATQTLMEKCETKGLDIFEAMIEIAMLTTDKPKKFSMLKDLAEYIYPKRKALEVTGEMNLELSRQVDEIKKLTKEEKIQMLRLEAKKLEEEDNPKGYEA